MHSPIQFKNVNFVFSESFWMKRSHYIDRKMRICMQYTVLFMAEATPDIKNEGPVKSCASQAFG